MRMRLAARLGAFAALAALVLAAPAAASAQTAGDCGLDAFRTRLDRAEASVVAAAPQETGFVLAGRAFRNVDIGLSGSLEGCVASAGPIPSLKPDYSYFYDVPEIAFPQERMLTDDPRAPFALPITAASGNTTPRFFARGTFAASEGAGVNLLLPADPKAWNGKLFVAQRGSGIYDRLDAIAELDPNDPFPAASGANVYAENMLARGYAVAFLRKDAIRPPLGVTHVTLRDGRTLTVSNTAHVVLALAMIEWAQGAVTRLLGRAPERTYYYGHSGGGITGRLINYSGANVRRNGKPIVDGLILDDAGNGVYLPVGFRDGSDIVLATESDHKRFVPQIDLARQLYNPISYLTAKRMNDAILAAKGLGDRHRYYELRDVSHFDAGMVRMVARDARPLDFLDLSGFESALIDDLDAWVAHGTAPPPSRSGAGAGVALPESACPLGTYIAPPTANGATTRLLPFDGATIQPATGTGETMTAGWRRLGLVAPGETVDRERFLGCIVAAVDRLTRARLLPDGAAPWYRARAVAQADAAHVVLR
jgi:hypothetical protein